MIKTCGLLLLGLVIASFGQPVFSFVLCPFAASIGYALCWFAIREWKVLSQGVVAALWFTAIQLIQLSWMASTEFQGNYILLVYAFLSLCLGVQFGFFSLLVRKFSSLSILQMVFLAGVWSLIEWSRLWVLCGFSWNPVGLSLTGFLSSLQLASLGGVYFLSWIVIMTNLLMLRSWLNPSLKRLRLVAGASCLVPYVVGMGILALPVAKQEEGRLSVGLIQTGLDPSEKGVLPGREEQFTPPLKQWAAICSYLAKTKKKSWDLIVFPEAALPIQAYTCVYPYEEVVMLLTYYFGKEVIQKMPSLEAPFAELKLLSNRWYVSNAFWAKALSRIFEAEVIVGFDHTELQGAKDHKNYNAAFYFSPDSPFALRYDKRILMPLAEYLPFSWLFPLVSQYGIFEFFTPGTKAQVFGRKIPMSVSICYEETFPHLVREGRSLGARLFVNLTNDGYYPRTLLPDQHYLLGRLRAVENGVPLVRACNTGITAVIDSTGRELASLGEPRGVLSYELPLRSHATLYTKTGDYGILGLCCIGIFAMILLSVGRVFNHFLEFKRGDLELKK